MFRSAELTRLAGMIVMLALIGMLMARLRDPGTIQALDDLLGNDSANVTAADAGPGKPAEKPAAKPAEQSAERSASSPKTSAGKPADKPPEKPGVKPGAAASPAAKPDPAKTSPEPAKPQGAATPAAAPPDEEKATDEDWEQAEAFREESQRILDRTLAVQPEEMDAYRRLIHWSEAQTAEQMFARAKKGLRFSDFVDSPGRYRGQLVELTLNARLIRRCPEPPKFASPLYEVWGETRQSGTFLYDCVCINLPEGLPVEQHIFERVRFVGYFLKVQVYHPGSAKPGDRPLDAPVFIGRLVWLKAPAAPPATEFSASTWWILGISAVAALLVVLWVIFGQPMAGRSPRLASAGLGTSSLPTLPNPWDVPPDPQGNNVEADDELLGDGAAESDPGRSGEGRAGTQSPGPNTLLDPGVLPPENGK